MRPRGNRCGRTRRGPPAVVGLISLCLLAGCGAGKSPTPTPSPVTFGPVTLVTGTESCPGVNPDWTTDPNGPWHVRDQPIECTDKTDDPRVSGTHTATWNMDVWGALDNGAGVQWGTVRLENAGGAWEGRLSGVASLPGRGDTIVIWYKGTGGYAGLSYFELITGSEPWKIQGQIFPGDPPPPYAEGGTTITRPEAERAGRRRRGVRGHGHRDVPRPTSEPQRPTPTASSTSATCPGPLHVDDRRPARHGRRSSTWNQDLWGRRTRTPQRGLRPVGHAAPRERRGSLGGPRHGRRSSDRGDIIVNWYKGTGDYEGLAYFELWTGSGALEDPGPDLPRRPPDAVGRVAPGLPHPARLRTGRSGGM